VFFAAVIAGAAGAKTIEAITNRRTRRVADKRSPNDNALIVREVSDADLAAGRLHRADLARAALDNAKLAGADLSLADLRGASLRRANLQRANLGEVNLEGADLSGSTLSGAKLILGRLHGALLRAADLRGATLYGADLTGADFTNARVENVTFIAAKWSPQSTKWSPDVYEQLMKVSVEISPGVFEVRAETEDQPAVSELV
jgi:uncharacterized protein YjbI with pentapeptide repeats